MDTQTPAPDGYNQSPSQPSSQQNWQPPTDTAAKKRRLILIGCAIVLVIIIGVSILLPMLSKKDKDRSNNTAQNDIYHFRDGYDIKEYGSEIGDPLALDMSKLGEAAKTTTGPIVYACNLLPIPEMNSQKAYLEPRANPLAVKRTYIDGNGKAAPEANQYTLPSGDDDNNYCSYTLQAGGILDISVYQPPFTATGAIDDAISRHFIQVASIGGLSTYKDKSTSGQPSFIMRNGNDAVEVLFNATKMSDSAQNSLLATIAKHFTEQQQAPKGPAIAAYNSPTYKKQYAIACDYLKNDDIKSLTDTDASYYVTEGLASAIAVHKTNDKLYNAISTSCTRSNTGLGSGLTAGPFDQELELTITSHNDDTPAKAFMETTAKDFSNKVSAAMGDEGFGFKDSAGQNTVLFRQGRFIVELVLDRTMQKNAGLSDTSAMTQKLTPYAQQVATALRKIQ